MMSSIVKEPQVVDINSVKDELDNSLRKQREAYFADPVPGLEQRKADLLTLKRMISENSDALIDAINEDYGNRSRHETLLAEIILTLDGINFAIKNLKRWMKTQRRKIDFTMYPGARNRVIPQPLGVVGIIVPWNFPLQLAFVPLTYVFAAGNRAMIKMSENSRHLSRLLIKLVADYFPPEKLAVFEETGDVGIQFSQMRFDHLVFTGSSATGRAVMAEAAKNLTPVTLELGGKTPAVVAPDFPMKKAVGRIMQAKLFNSGQVCVNVDYIFVPQAQVEEFVNLSRAWVNEHCPDINSPDYTAIIDQRSFNRLADSLVDAETQGAKLVNLSGDQQPDAKTRKFPLHLVLNATDEMILLQREIFGPIMPVIPYTDPQEVTDYINQRDRPLAFYPFSEDRKTQQFYLERVMSGGVCVNDVLLHPGQHDLPFGGVGPSGMGQYHGYEGFANFSKLRPVFYQAGFSALKFLAPPYGKFANRMLNIILKLKS
jgi:coniferyl-aldehyde dehydrogenase